MFQHACVLIFLGACLYFFFFLRKFSCKHSKVSSRNVWIRLYECVCVWTSCQQPSCVFCIHLCVCVFKGGIMLGSVVLSLLLQQETGTEVIRSQGTVGGKVTIAQASSSLIRVTGVTGSVLLPRCVLSCQRPQWNKLKPRHKSIWSAHVRTHWQEAGPVFFSTLHLVLVLSIMTFLLSWLIVVPLHS